ncbi:MAG TPA: tRNA pseudouridine(55) synthase TruB [Pseudomonadales bacterium]|nr:tRNA pseudouridine(55) synthase TruB [Pseudomonadales bacterium]
MRRGKGREVNGILILDKPAGITSNAALQQAKRLYSAAKAGHTGSLDPIATGVLPLCFGEATKFSQFLLEADKRYRATVKLGVATASGDADGEILTTAPVPALSESALESMLDGFRGVIEQTPSMYSAIKIDGQPLYKLARQGLEVERKSREVTIYELILHGFTVDELDLEIACSKGTYIRSMAEDMGRVLGCGAHVSRLRRTASGPFEIGRAHTLDALRELKATGDFPALDAVLEPASSAVQHWPEVKLTELTASYLKQGQAVQIPHAPTAGWVRIFSESGETGTDFLGVGEILEDGRVAPRRLVATR